jgi:ABC-type transporter Mla maintaining outer membrane lipid asymmetry permease subunit MlaE
VSGYAFAYARGLKASPIEFFTQIAGAMSLLDFPLWVFKTLLFGALTGWVICYQGLARPMTLEEVGPATTRTVAVCVVGCLMLDALFITVYLIL